MKKIEQKFKTWRKVKLGEIFSEIESGGRPTGGALMVNDGIPSIGAEHLDDKGGFDFSSIKYVPEKYFNNSARGKIKESDILVVKDGATIGKVSKVSKNFPFPIAMVNEHVFIIRGKKELVDQTFLFYKIFTREGKETIKNSISGSAQGGLKKDFFDYWETYLPSPTEQKRIAEILSAFDDKIELNNKISRTLEEMASAIFKEWFVKFRFPGYEKAKFVDSELGKIPEGWKMERLIKVTDLIKGQKPKNVLGQAIKGAIEYLLIDSFVSNAKFYTTDLATPKCKIGDSVVVMDGASSGRVFYGKNGAIGSTLAIFKPKQDAPISNQYLFMFLKRIESELLDNLTGSAIPHLDKNFLKEHKIVIPNPAIMKMITETINTILDRQALIVNENQKLSALRDLLLPKLMSGEMGIKV